MLKSKTLLIIPVLLLVLLAFTSQDSTKYQYIDVQINQKLLSQKVNIVINEGKKLPWMRDNRLKDENGKPVVFENEVNALNKLGEDGWELKQSYSVAVSNSMVVIHHIMMREVK